MGDSIGGGVEIECWREVVPVLFHEARRLTVHVQFRTLKFSMTRREFHIKLSSEEDHCFLYKAAVTQEGYQRFMHYHNLDVPFEQFSDYMHHLIHAVKNGHDPGERFFINILAPATTALPQTIEFIVTQRQMGCVVQSRRLNLTFTLASDAELKEHLINCFDRLKREKDHAQRRNAELEIDLSTERSRSKELEDRNRYLQRELEFSQTLLKSAENIQKHYEHLLKQQRCQGNGGGDVIVGGSSTPQLLMAPSVICGGGVDEKSSPLNINNNHDVQQQGVLPQLLGNNNVSMIGHHSNNNNNMNNISNPIGTGSSTSSHLESVMSYLTANATNELGILSGRGVGHHEDDSSTSSLIVPSIVVPQQQQQQQQPTNVVVGQQQQQQHQVLVAGQQQQPVNHQQQSTIISNSQSLLSSDTKCKLKGAAKRKASFHNLTNPNPATSNAVNSSLEQQQHAQGQLPQNHLHNHGNGVTSAPSSLHEHLARLHEAHHQQQQQLQHANLATSSSTSLINPITAMNLLDDRSDMYSVGTQGSNDGSYLMRDAMMMRDYLNDTSIHHGSLSSPLDTNTNELIDRLSELNDNEWGNMKVEYGSDDFSLDLADVDNGYGGGTNSAGLHLNDSAASMSASGGNASGSEDGSPNDSRNLNFDGVLSYFKCLICDNSFTIGSSHMVQHVLDSQRCTICTEIPPFDSKDDLLKHMVGHSTRVYACQYCGKENPRVHYLKIHVRSHTGEKPYTCHQCGRGFADASTWRRHERVHTGEKPYQCNICGRKIARRDNVKIHMRSHMRAKAQLSCRTCGKPFTQASHLALHERICLGPSNNIVETKPLISTSPFPGSTA